MQPPQQHPRIDLTVLKAQLVKKLGPEGSKRYFGYLHRFLSLKLSKAEFNKLCFGILGRESIALHNQFIRSILRNASTAKFPPLINHKDEFSADIYHESASHNNTAQPSCSVSLSNGGDILSIGKANFSHQLTENKSKGPKFVLENGNIERLVQHHQEIAPPTQENNEPFVSRPSNAPEVRRLQQDCELGPPRDRAGGAHISSSGHADVFSQGALLDSVLLRERMERVALFLGLEGVSLDCANILNLGLNSYLKGLIGSSISLTGSISGQNLPEIDARKHYPEGTYRVPISLQELRVAMEKDPPRQLGQDWPLLLEKISTRSFEE